MAKEETSIGDGGDLPESNEGRRERRLQERARAREVNRQISADLKAQKATAANRKRHTGVLAAVAERAEHVHKHDIIAQVIFLFEKGNLPAGTGRKRSMSETTQTQHKEALIRAMRELKEERMTVRNLSEVGRKHVLALIKRWVKEGQSYGTIQNKVSSLRVMTTLMNRPGVVPRDGAYLTWLNDHGIDLVAMRTSKVALEPKTWSVKGVDPMRVIEKMREEHPVVAMCLELQYAFGLRAAEATHAEPVSGDLGDFLHIRGDSRGGAKGGKSRTVPFSEDPTLRAWQQDALERAKRLARNHRLLRLAVPGKDYEQMQNHFYYVCGKYGITKKGMGVVPHGLRHMYAQRRYQELTGLPAPVQSTVEMSVYRANAEVIREGARQVSVEAGHQRPSVTGAYNGSVYSQSKEQTARAKAWLDRLQSCDGLKALAQSLDVRSMYLSGKAAKGVRLLPGDAVRLLVDKEVTPQVMYELGLLQRTATKLLKLDEGVLVDVVHVEQAQEERDSYLELNLQV